MQIIRPPAVAGMFYPAARQELGNLLQNLLLRAAGEGPVPKALIVPHAGYIYSGPIAASGYSRLYPARDTIRRVLLVGPSHRVGFEGVAYSSATAFATPLGNIRIDTAALECLADLPNVRAFDRAHEQEHSLEVHLPFLQNILAEFTLIPLVTGHATPAYIGAVLSRLWGGTETLIVVSSDLSHYHSYNAARRLDAATSRAIEQLRDDLIDDRAACGCVPVRGLLHAARQFGLDVETIDLRNSGDTAGDHSRVVGYGAYGLH